MDLVFPEPAPEVRASLERYLDGRASAEDERVVRAWMAEDPANAELVGRIVQARRVAEAAPGLWDTDEAWTRLDAKMRGEASAEVIELPRRGGALVGMHAPAGEVQRAAGAVTARARVVSAQRRRGWPSVLRIAAGIAALIGGAVLWQQREALFAPAEIAVREVAAGTGERIRVTLDDGTEIVLGSESRLWIPEKFGRERLIRLEGEAVFDVARDARRPFVVHAGGTETRVLGTRFGVRAFESDGYVEVTVVEGLVAVGAAELSDGEGGRSPRSDAGEAAQQVTRLGAGQAVRVANGVVGVPRRIDAERYLAWTEGYLAFERVPLSDVARELERRFGMRIELAEPELADLRLTADFGPGTPVAEVVRLVSLSLGLEYREVPGGFRLSNSVATAGRVREGGSNR